MSLGQCFSRGVNAWVEMRRYGWGPIQRLTCTPDPWEPGWCPFTLCDSSTGIWQCLLKWISGALFIYNQATVPDFPRAKVYLSIIQSFLQSSNTFQAPYFVPAKPSEWLPRWLSGKESACNAGDVGWIPGLGRSPGEENGNPLQYSCLEDPMDRGAWQATVHGVAKESHRT